MAAVNFHGYWGYVLSVRGNTVTFHFDCLRSVCFTARSTGAVRVGDRVNWRRKTTMELLGSSTVTAVTNATLLHFDGDISRYGAELVAEFPETANAGWSVRDSRFFDVYQRLFVQSGPGEVVNNSFARMGSSISIRSTVLSRNEGGHPRGIIVANNTFSNVSLTPGGGGVSSSPVTIGRLGESPVVNYSDIFIFGNSMTLAGGAAIFAESVTNLTVESNTLASPCVVSADVDPEVGATARQAVYLSHAVGATVRHNLLVDESKSCTGDPVTHSSVLGLGRSTSAVTLDGRAIPPTKNDDDSSATRSWETGDDWHYPTEEPGELAAARPIRVDKLSVADKTLSISLVEGPRAPELTLSVGQTQLNWTLRALLVVPERASRPVAVLERSWARWGALLYLAEPVSTAQDGSLPDSACKVAPANPCFFLRKGVGELDRLSRPRYALTRSDADYFARATTSTDDYLKQRFIADTADHEPTFTSASRALPPTLDYTMVKNIEAHSGFSVSPQGRIMAANFSIREQMLRGDAPLSHGGLLLFDPARYLPFSWPPTNFSEMKSSMLGRFSRAVTVGVFDAHLHKGFELLAAPSPGRGVATQPYDRAELLLRLEAHDGARVTPRYFAVETCSLCEDNSMLGSLNCSEVAPEARCGASPQLVRQLTDPALFYSALLEHTSAYEALHRGVNATADGRAVGALDLQFQGSTEGSRLVDTARSVISAGLSNFIGRRPNYGDGSVYWSVSGLDRGALPLQSFALNRALLLWGHHREAADRIEYYFNCYVRNSSGVTPTNAAGMARELWDRTPGKIDVRCNAFSICTNACR